MQEANRREGADLSGLTVIFDLDGTLVDSAPDLAAAMNAVLTAEGLPTLSPAEVRPLTGEGAAALMRRGFEAAGRAWPDGEERARLIHHFLAHYEANLTAETHPFPGAEDCLAHLRDAGAALAVCTNKPHGLAVKVLEGLGLSGWFAVVLGRESLPVCKPDPTPLLYILAETGAARGVMIGDTQTDLDAARGANMPCMLASFGYGTPDLRLEGAEQRFDDYEALFGLVRQAGSPG